MRSEPLGRLIQDRLDGVATAEESAQLEARLEGDVRARAEHTRMERLFRALGDAEFLECPPGLAEGAVRAAERQVVMDRGPRGLGSEGWTGLVRLGFAFAVGTIVGIIGVLGLSGLRSSPPPGSSVVGSMLLSSSGARTIERQRVPFPTGAIVLESRRVEGGLVIVADPGPVPVTRIVLEHDPKTIRWIGLKSIDTTMEPGVVAWTPGRVTLEPKGPGPYVLVYAAGAHAGPLGITLEAEGQTQRTSLRTSGTEPAPGK